MYLSSFYHIIGRMNQNLKATKKPDTPMKLICPVFSIPVIPVTDNHKIFLEIPMELY